MKHSLATLILLLTIGVNALAAQQGKSGHTTARSKATLFDDEIEESILHSRKILLPLW
jgi:hypothetical protein